MLPEPIKVPGLGGVPTYITASARVKITLGVRVVYVMNVWVTNIGEDVEVLLGMNFMYAVEFDYVCAKGSPNSQTRKLS
ncbi:hypothetical protein PF002_g27354 [Phytophthora fragariae]|nr:hypothetical protein PF009_g27705 [Phytophthora fragariae]KAE9181164.1 hypothetical protein PF002_g27354 [Phytophthora fragariae]